MKVHHSLKKIITLSSLALLACALAPQLRAQDEVHAMGGTNAERLRIATASFKAMNSDSQTTALKASLMPLFTMT